MSPLPLAKLILENMAFSADHTFWYRTEKQTSMLPSPAVTGHAGQPKTFPWDRPPVTYSPEWRMEELCVREPTSKRKGKEGAEFHRFTNQPSLHVREWERRGPRVLHQCRSFHGEENSQLSLGNSDSNSASSPFLLSHLSFPPSFTFSLDSQCLIHSKV